MTTELLAMYQEGANFDPLLGVWG